MKSNALRKRETTLLELKKLMMRFKSEISFSSRTVGELVKINGNYCFCKTAVLNPCFSDNPIEALKSGIADIFNEHKDIAIFNDFVAGLGISDTIGQIEHIELYSELLDVNINEAHEEYEKKSKLFIMLGLFAGISLCVILI